MKSLPKRNNEMNVVWVVPSNWSAPTGFKAEEDGETEAAEFVFESLKDDTMEYARNKGISLGVHWD
jgi:hypothetical protein